MRAAATRRLAAALIALATAGCEDRAPAPAPEPTTAAGTPATPAAAATYIPCAHGREELARTCTVERRAAEEGTILTLRHPDGAFRRLNVAADGSVSAADGAERAGVADLGNGTIEVTLGGDRYRLPPRAE